MTTPEQFNGWRCARDDRCAACPVGEFDTSKIASETLVHSATILSNISPSAEYRPLPPALAEKAKGLKDQQIKIVGSDVVDALEKALNDRPEGCNPHFSREEVTALQPQQTIN